MEEYNLLNTKNKRKMTNPDIKHRVITYLKQFSELIRKHPGYPNTFIRTYETIVPDFLEFDYNKGNINYHMGSKVIEKELVDSAKILDIFIKFNEKDDEFQEILDLLSNKYHVQEHFLIRLVNDLIYFLAHELLEPEEAEKFSSKIQVLFNDLELKPSKCSAKAWIDGIWLAEDEFFINQNIKIRRITPDDMDYYLRADHYGGIELKHGFMDPTTILEINMLPDISREKTIVDDKFLNFKTLMKSQLRREIEYISLTLRLFRLGSVFIHKVEEDIESLIQRGKTISGDFIKIKNLVRYEIKSKDIDQISKILDLIKKKKDRIYTKSSTILIALQRYSNAFLNAENIESLVTDVFSCFESIFLGGAERQELSRRLIQRISIFLKPFGVNSIEIYNFLKKGYRIRSIYSHGSRVNFKKEKIENVGVFKTRILECARICLLVYLQIIGTIKKENLLDLLDRSLLDDASYQVLNRLITSNCKIKLSPDILNDKPN